MSYIGNSPENVLRNRRAIYEFVATAGQTAFSGVDSNGATLDLLQDNEQSVFLNGVRIIATDDYTVSGETLTLTQAASVGDILIVETQGEVANATTYTRSEADARYVNYNGDVISGNIQIAGDLTASSLAIDTDTLYVDATNNRVGINLPGLNPQEALHVAGNIRVNNNQEFKREKLKVNPNSFEVNENALSFENDPYIKYNIPKYSLENSFSKIVYKL